MGFVSSYGGAVRILQSVEEEADKCLNKIQLII